MFYHSFDASRQAAVSVTWLWPSGRDVRRRLRFVQQDNNSRDLWVYLDADVTMRAYFMATVTSCFAAFQQIPIFLCLADPNSRSGCPQGWLLQLRAGWHFRSPHGQDPVHSQRRRSHHTNARRSPLVKNSRANRRFHGFVHFNTNQRLTTKHINLIEWNWILILNIFQNLFLRCKMCLQSLQQVVE